jgi:hypothetical protein
MFSGKIMLSADNMTSFVDPDTPWIRIQLLSGSGSRFIKNAESGTVSESTTLLKGTLCQKSVHKLFSYIIPTKYNFKNEDTCAL